MKLQALHPPGHYRDLYLLCLTGAAILLVIKLYLAARLDLYSDEIFYWLASQRLAPAYSDLPFTTALLVRLGTQLDPGNTLAVRAAFIALGSCIPLLVYWLAVPITGKSRAAQSALLSLCIPLGGFMGLLAVPDVPLVFFGLLAIGLFERALRTDRRLFWLLTGLAVAAGLSTHYRFLLYPAAALVFLLAFRSEHRQWRNPRLWLAMTIAGIGLLPVLWFNLTNELASASFYLVERHPWTFQPAGLLHGIKQAGLVTPPLYLLFGFTLWTMYKLARNGQRSAALLLSFSLVNLLVYLVLAPWTDSSSTSVHWPLSGYFPILVYAPATLERAFHWTRDRFGEFWGGLVKTGVPAIGYLGSIVALAAIGSQSFQTPLQAVLGAGALSNKMAGWREFTSHTAMLLDAESGDSRPVVVADNYYTAAQLMFAGLGPRIFTTDNDKAVRDGRRLQLELWGMTEPGLKEQAGESLLFITEDSTLTLPETETALARICRLVTGLQFQDQLELFAGDKAFSYYRADRIVSTAAESDLHGKSCPFPARGWLEPPLTEGATLSGIVPVQGWAYKEDIGIESVRLVIDSARIIPVNYGISRPDVVSVMNVTSDPNAPRLGFYDELNTFALSEGTHEIAVELTDKRGVVSAFGERTVYIDN